MFFSLNVDEQLFFFFFTFHLDFPQIVNLTVKEPNVNVTWLPTFKGECNMFGYLIYYRKVISKVNTGQWNLVLVSQYNATNYNLQLQCYMEYEITITALSANGETPLNRGKLWKVKTEGGKYSQNQQQGLLRKERLGYSVFKFWQEPVMYAPVTGASCIRE